MDMEVHLQHLAVTGFGAREIAGQLKIGRGRSQSTRITNYRDLSRVIV